MMEVQVQHSLFHTNKGDAVCYHDMNSALGRSVLSFYISVPFPFGKDCGKQILLYFSPRQVLHSLATGTSVPEKNKAGLILKNLP